MNHHRVWRLRNLHPRLAPSLSEARREPEHDPLIISDLKPGKGARR